MSKEIINSLLVTAISKLNDKERVVLICELQERTRFDVDSPPLRPKCPKCNGHLLLNSRQHGKVYCQNRECRHSWKLNE